MKCPMCNQEQWEEGTITQSGRGDLDFRPKNSKLMVMSYPRLGGKVCKMCGYAYLSVDVEKLKSTLKG